MELLHFVRPGTGFGDAMPMYHDGTYYLYYLRAETGRPLTWALLTSKDLRDWTEQPDVIVTGGPGSPDARGLTTGCVIFAEGRFHAFYGAVGDDGSLNMLHAVSDDGIVFEKENRPLFARTSDYRDDDTWRDPQVIRLDDGLYHMIFCARTPEIRGDFMPGALGHAVSADLVTWKLLPPLWTGCAAAYVECPQALPMGERWALLYYWHESRIRTAAGFGELPEKHGRLSPMRFDFMAAKALQDGERTILFGWIPRKDCDCGERIWGGNLAIPRVLTLEEDGTPSCRFLPETLVHAVKSDAVTISECGVLRGDVRKTEDGLILPADSMVQWTGAEKDILLDFDMTFENRETEVTMLVRGEDENRGGYILIWAPGEHRLSIREQYQWDQRPELAGMPLEAAPGEPFSVRLVLHGDILELEAGGRETLTYRMPKHVSGRGLALSVTDGGIKLSNFLCRTFPE